MAEGTNWLLAGTARIPLDRIEWYGVKFHEGEWLVSVRDDKDENEVVVSRHDDRKRAVDALWRLSEDVDAAIGKSMNMRVLSAEGGTWEMARPIG